MVKKKCSLIENQELVRLIRNKALEEVEKIIEKQDIIIMTDFDGKHNLIDLNKLMNKLKNMRDEK